MSSDPKSTRALDELADRKRSIVRLLTVAGALLIVLLVLWFQRWSDSPIDDADYAVKVTPTYPQAARQAGIEGRVVVAVTIGADGRLLFSTIRSSSGSVLLDDAALAAARASVFRAPSLRGIAMQRSYTILYTFALRSPSPQPTRGT